MRAAGTLVRLSGHDHVVVLAKGHSRRLPRVEEDLRVHCAADALLVADGPVLLEGGRAVDRGLVRARALVQRVAAVWGVDVAPVLARAAGVVLAVVLDDVVLDQRVAGPAVDGEVLPAACQSLLSASLSRTAVLQKVKDLQSCRC